jgi:hypothetical protein
MPSVLPSLSVLRVGPARLVPNTYGSPEPETLPPNRLGLNRIDGFLRPANLKMTFCISVPAE